MHALADRATEEQTLLTELLLRRQAQRDPVAYAQAIEIPGAPMTDNPNETRFLPVETQVAAHHRLLLRELEIAATTRYGRLMVFMPPGSAKALALDTPIPTPDGWTTMGALRVGDRVFDENGRPCNVTWVSPIWRDRPVYRVVTDCGDSIVADRDHEWLVRLCGKRPVFKIKETHQLAKRRTKRPMIRRASALDLPSADLPIDPYLLGFWLGDGNSSGLTLTKPPEDQIHIRAELEAVGIQTTDRAGPMQFGVLGQRAAFARAGLLNDPAHRTFGAKHIPPAYLRSSRAQRLSLLQGLIDSDGTVCRQRGCTTFSNTNEALALGVQELARSLGVKAAINEGQAVLNGKDCGPYWRVSFYLDGSARLPRKARLARNAERTVDTYIDVTPCGTADTVCIEVDSPSHLFLCGRSMTPTHNSTYCSSVYPTRYLGEEVGRRAILASYGDRLATKHSRRARQIVRTRRYRAIYGATLSAEQSASDEWALSNGSEYLACGILAGVTGNRAGLLTIDDPVRGREAADSATIRDKTWDAYQDDLLTRLLPGGAVVIVQTRWHADDLAGRILPEDWAGESGPIMCRDGQVWRVLCLQAQCTRTDDPLRRQPGDMLWPQWFDARHWDQFRVNPRTWSALFQQVPAPEEGTYFQAGWLRSWAEKPRDLAVYATSDYAVTADGGDWTVLRIWGVDPQGCIYRLAGWRGQTAADAWIEQQCALIRQWRPFAWFGEAGVIQKAIEPMLVRRMRELDAHCRLEWLPSIHDKPTRARGFQARASMGMVRFEQGADLSEFLQFPAGRHDDEVDAASLIGRALDEAHPAIAQRPKVEKPVDRYRERETADAAGWRTV